ncbi:unnamed protein product [Rhodiola kirilowii]
MPPKTKKLTHIVDRDLNQPIRELVNPHLTRSKTNKDKGSTSTTQVVMVIGIIDYLLLRPLLIKETKITFHHCPKLEGP